MSNIDKSSLAKTRELATLMVERISMNPVSCKLLNEAWKKEFPDEVAIADRMLALLDELEAKDSTISTQQQEIRTLLNAIEQATQKRNHDINRITEMSAENCNMKNRIAELESALNRHYELPDVYDMAIKQFESLSNHKHHFINGTCVECLKSE